MGKLSKGRRIQSRDLSWKTIRQVGNVEVEVSSVDDFGQEFARRSDSLATYVRDKSKGEIFYQCTACRNVIVESNGLPLCPKCESYKYDGVISVLDKRAGEIEG